MNLTPATFRFKELTDLDAVCEGLMAWGKDYHVWLFQGQMGAGKTTIIKTLCQNLGITTLVHSPTFALVNEYSGPEKEIVYHFDFYRIKDETEALDIGIEEYFDSGHFCFVEWPENIESLWPQRYLLINLHLLQNGERLLEAQRIG
ncbi:tRNA threonylcarbamoyladenosine biosynthesis protein TsaE [Dyadobacter sp. CECT 9275]|uniref:tRNA threonylcarbamoyladenosine biosynthesis protein TsaE n=1 Tax=Dyadobacter helix TaxID=2822344 RepID=A0A916JFW9_9BACT|nr:tRNA (adenosine(37)-N6)-threonylcarbamoyltransferase complex ATPase subunit type 1 TsaE [Dyadobacter sp. CECT 9275]CAG5004184.1 tRNA threonylcarbamoyladenosine biosynthesis protein TsaE [Dyadobacter sp. CECT 9275]